MPVLHNSVEENTHYETLAVKVVERGKRLNLYSVYLPTGRYNSVPSMGGGTYMTNIPEYATVFIIENKVTRDKQSVRITKSEMIADLTRFIEDVRLMDTLYSNKIKYRNIPHLIKAYNQK